MKALFSLGLVVLVLGVLSLFIALPHSENHGIKAGDASIGIQTTHKEKVVPAISAVLILGGVGMIIAGRSRS